MNKDAETDPDVKPAAAAWFRRMEDGDEGALTNWREWRALSIKKYAEEYARLNVAFDVYTGESEVGREWQDKALEMLSALGLISDSDGAKLVDLEKWKLQKAVLRKKGTPLVCCILGRETERRPQMARRSTSRATSAARSSGTRSTSSTR